MLKRDRRSANPNMPPPSASAAVQRARRAARRAKEQEREPELGLPDYKPRPKAQRTISLDVLNPVEQGEDALEDGTGEESLQRERSAFFAKSEKIRADRELLDSQFLEMQKLYLEKRRKLDMKDEDLYRQYMGL